MSVKELASNPKVATVVVAGTTGAGLSTYLDLIPTDIGKLATLAGLTLSVVLIYVHLRKGHAEIRKHNTETEILKKIKADLENHTINGYTRQQGEEIIMHDAGKVLESLQNEPRKLK